MDRTARVKALRRAVAKVRTRLDRSMAHCGDPRPRDRERWALMTADIARLEMILEQVLAGQNPPMSERTGAMTRELPDAFAR